MITAVIPYYNMGRYIADAVNSLLAQTRKDLDIIIVNDGSDEENRLALRQFEDYQQVRVIHQENAGPQAARHRGCEAAESRYIFFMDADDTIDSTFVAKAAALLEEHEDICLVTSRFRFFGDRSGVSRRQPCTVENILAGRAHSGYGLFRKSDWESMPGKDITLPYQEDWDFWLCMITSGKKACCIEEYLYNYRRHGDSISSRRRLHKAKKLDSIGYLLEKHKDFYARYPQVVAELVAERNAGKDTSLPRFMAFKKLKYRLVIFLASLPVLKKTLGKVVQKYENKLNYFNNF